MVLTVKHKRLIYKKFEQDIWGYCFNHPDCRPPSIVRNTSDINELYKYKTYYHRFFFKLYWEKRRQLFNKNRKFIYTFEAPKFFRQVIKINFRFISIRLTRLYYLTFQDHQFRRLFRRAAKMTGNFQNNYLQFLECRILSILYRLNFHYDIFYLLSFLKISNNVFIDFKSVNIPNIILPVGNFLTINVKFHDEFRRIWKKRIKERAFLALYPPSIFVSYKLFFAYLMKEPQKAEFLYPFALDVQRITGYY